MNYTSKLFLPLALLASAVRIEGQHLVRITNEQQEEVARGYIFFVNNENKNNENNAPACREASRSISQQASSSRTINKNQQRKSDSDEKEALKQKFVQTFTKYYEADHGKITDEGNLQDHITAAAHTIMRTWVAETAAITDIYKQRYEASPEIMKAVGAMPRFGPDFHRLRLTILKAHLDDKITLTFLNHFDDLLDALNMIVK